MAVEWTVGDALQERFRRMAGTPIEHDVRPYYGMTGDLERTDLSSLGDEALASRAGALRSRAAREPLDSLLSEVFAVGSEAASRLLGLRPFPVQLAAAAAIHRGRLAQLATGEGKTLVAVLPAALRAFEGRGVHVFTANDYLAKRDAEWMGPLYRFFGLRCAFVVQGMTPDERRSAYSADITYVTAKEAGFDYLRDHTCLDAHRTVHRGHHFAIVDEADFILIDEARVPLVIAGEAPDPPFDPVAVAAAVRHLRPGIDFTADDYGRTVVLTEAGFRHAGALLGAQLEDPAEHLLLSAVHVALHARALLRRDRDYVVRDGRVEIVDEWTGRVAEHRRWPNGIQPAVEAKEGVPVRSEGRVLGSIPMQHFMRLYTHLAGMTATAEPSAEELFSFFGLRTVVFSPNQRCRRIDEPDVVFTHRAAKLEALLAEIGGGHATGRPILVGTASVHESEEIAALLAARGIASEVLNARQDAREAQVIAQAGRPHAVTIATNMAGRGTDIVLGGGDPRMREDVVAAGGLYVIGTNRHESRRIDDQLRGRAGRQGDPGTSRFFISLEDDLIQRYGVMSLIPTGHRPVRQLEPVTDPVVAREIGRAQRIIEGQNFELRRTLWKYSALVEEQRHIVYDWRKALLLDESDPGICAESAADHYARLLASAGADAVRHAEQLITAHALDRRWAGHLAFIEDVREGIHLQRYGGREPVQEFHRQIVEGFSRLMEDVRADTAAAFERLRAVDGVIDLSSAGVAGSSSTWTYLVNDDPFSTLGLSLLASRNVGTAGAMGMLAMLYLPLTALVTGTVFVKRWLGRRGRGG